jgi:hypothetical protein
MHFIAQQYVKKPTSSTSDHQLQKQFRPKEKPFGRTVQRRFKLDICRAKINDPTGTG